MEHNAQEPTVVLANASSRSSPPTSHLPGQDREDVERPKELGSMPLTFAGATDYGLPADMSYVVEESVVSKDCLSVSVPLPSMDSLSAEQQQVVKELDTDGDGKLSVSEVMSGVKKQAEVQRSVRVMRRRELGLVCAVVLALVAIFGLCVAANWQFKELYLSNTLLVNQDQGIIAVASAKIAVPLYLAPFLTFEHLRDIETVGYYDCSAQEEIWGRVTSVQRYVPAEFDDGADVDDETFDDDGAGSRRVQEPLGNLSNYSATFLLASGRSLVVDASGERLFFPEDNHSQELCGELQCAQLQLRDVDVRELENQAHQALGEEVGRRLQGGGRGGRCRRCGGGGGRRRRGGGDGGRRRRGGGGGDPAPAPPPPPPPLPIATTPAQEAVLQTVQAVTTLVSQAGNRAARADVLGGIVRLVFHDAGSFDGATGGADGCVDLEAIENRGLDQVIQDLEPIVASAAGRMSKADVWALAANVAIEFAGGPQLGFASGRVDSASCTGHGSRHPDAELGHSHIKQVFVDRLGFADREVGALMGAHVLGRAQTSISGYDGKWADQNDRFTNEYFRDLLNRGWNKRSLSAFEGSARTQWNGPQDTMMLNTDIEIAFDTSSGCSRAGGNGGGGGRCPRAVNDFSSAITEFAQSQVVFFEVFVPAWKKLSALGNAALDCTFDDCATPGPL